VDDYITKPFKEKDLLAVVKGKLRRSSRTDSYTSQIEELNINFDDLKIHREGEKRIAFFLMKWTNNYGARLQFSFPKTISKESIQDLGQRLMQTAMSLRTDKKSQKKQIPIKGGLSVNLKPLNQEAYVYFDKVQENDIYMIGITTPTLNYIDTFELKELFQEIFLKMQEETEVDLEKYWKKINLILQPLEQ
jgi:hypothetical protein